MGDSLVLNALKYDGEAGRPPCFDFCLSPEVLSAPGAWISKKGSRVIAIMEALHIRNLSCLKQLLTTLVKCENPIALSWAIQSEETDDVLYAETVRVVYHLVDVPVHVRQRFFTEAFIFGTVDALSILTGGWEGCSEYLRITIPDHYGGRSVSRRDPTLTVEWLLREGFVFENGDTTFLSRALQIGSIELVRLGRREHLLWDDGFGGCRDGFVRAASEGLMVHLKECCSDHDAAGAMFGSGRGLDMAMGAAEGGSDDTLLWILEMMSDSHPDMGQIGQKIATAAAANGSVSTLKLVFSPDVLNDEVISAAVGHLGVLRFLKSKGVELSQELVHRDTLIRSVCDGDKELFFWLLDQFPADSICDPELLKEAVQSGLYDVVERILSDCPELPVDIGLVESAVSPERDAMEQAGEEGCFFEIAVLLYSRVDRTAWEGGNNVCSLAEEAGNYAVVRWAVELGCYRMYT